MGTEEQYTLASVEFEVYGQVQALGTISLMVMMSQMEEILPRSPKQQRAGYLIFKPEYIKAIKIDVWRQNLGCYFTKYCKELAEQLGVCGWVKNSKKGTIVGKLQGYKPQLDHMHNQAAGILHQEIALKYGLISRWLSYYKPVLENDRAKLYWDRPIIMDRTIFSNKPDIVLMDRAQSRVFLVDVTIPYDENLVQADAAKRTKIDWLSTTGSPGCKIEKCDLTNWEYLSRLDYNNFSIRF